MATPFISPQDLVDYLGRGTAIDQGFVIATDAACDICRTVAEQDFNQVLSDTAILDGTGTDAVLLPRLPVQAVSMVTVNDAEVTDFSLNGNGILFRGSAGVDPRPVWPMGRQNIAVTYDHGYAEVDIPRDVRMVALSVASRIAVQGPALEESVGDVRVKYAAASTDLTPGELRILKKYRQVR
jgi:hypothetical protein